MELEELESIKRREGNTLLTVDGSLKLGKEGVEGLSKGENGELISFDRRLGCCWELKQRRNRLETNPHPQKSKSLFGQSTYARRANGVGVEMWADAKLPFAGCKY